jgi:hypothetical protein
MTSTETLPPLNRPVLSLLQHHRAHQSHDHSVVAEDAQHAGPPFNFLIDALEQAASPDLLPL